MTLDQVADWIGVDRADVAWTISEYLALDLHEDDIPYPLVGELRSVLEPHGERTDLDRYWPIPGMPTFDPRRG
ncbi:hypothetical protein [Pseudonocardia sp. NPDC049154]|uniref:hypothetical protein n=1 Tax=Pseudonocardia sp. NPDC049154 TaxID=3155501 RepID=UPI0033C5C6D6